MRRMILILSVVALAGCGEHCQEYSPTDFINEKKPPVTLYAADKTTGDIVLQDGDGMMRCFNGGFYAARAIASSYKPGDVLKR